MTHFKHVVSPADPLVLETVPTRPPPILWHLLDMDNKFPKLLSYFSNYDLSSMAGLSQGLDSAFDGMRRFSTSVKRPETRQNIVINVVVGHAADEQMLCLPLGLDDVDRKTPTSNRQ